MANKFSARGFMKKLLRPSSLIFSVSLLIGNASVIFAQANFYEEKSLRIIVGLAPGGGYDVYARTIARHMGKHILGHPSLVVENMTGAGSIIAANYLYKIAKPDGLTIGHYLGGIALQQLLGKSGIEFDALKFKYLGVPAQMTSPNTRGDDQFAGAGRLRLQGHGGNAPRFQQR
jgi:tripartite-type tricarboxylate transporter receptor subunit TctC